jgi:hypothetical protein
VIGSVKAENSIIFVIVEGGVIVENLKARQTLDSVILSANDLSLERIERLNAGWPFRHEASMDTVENVLLSETQPVQVDGIVPAGKMFGYDWPFNWNDRM